MKPLLSPLKTVAGMLVKSDDGLRGFVALSGESKTDTLIGNERELKRAIDDGTDAHASAVSAFEYGDVA